MASLAAGAFGRRLGPLRQGQEFLATAQRRHLSRLISVGAGNIVLDSSRSSETGHADLAVAAAIAFYLSDNAPRALVEAPVAGYWG